VTGFDLVRAARRRHPDLPVVYMTAYDIQTRPHVVDNSLTVRKPLRLTEVADAALDFLAAQPSGYGADRFDGTLEA
jgi:CheY-like chemotaxis protein